MTWNEDIKIMAYEIGNYTIDNNRKQIMEHVLSDASGIYHNKTKLKILNKKYYNDFIDNNWDKYNNNNNNYNSYNADQTNPISKTVFVNVFETGNIEYEQKYKELIDNFLCNMNDLEYEIIIYILDKDKDNVREKTKQLRSIHPFIRFVEYPYSLFWKYIATKETEIFSNKNNVYYQNNYPTFNDHGFLVMLIPILEILELGYNVIYFDVDIVLLKDILPLFSTPSYLARNDILFSPEMRACIYQSVPENKDSFNWELIEANTGTMFLKSNPRVITLYKEWLYRLVNSNARNDQKKLKLVEMKAVQIFDCNHPISNIYHANETA
eukprot:gene18148-25525_t